MTGLSGREDGKEGARGGWEGGRRWKMGRRDKRVNGKEEA